MNSHILQTIIPLHSKATTTNKQVWANRIQKKTVIKFPNNYLSTQLFSNSFLRVFITCLLFNKLHLCLLGLNNNSHHPLRLSFNQTILKATRLSSTKTNKLNKSFHLIKTNLTINNKSLKIKHVLTKRIMRWLWTVWENVLSGLFNLR
jgi:hypothetical protein